MKRANKHNRLSCLISTSISFNSMLFSNYQNCGYVVYKFVNCVVWFVTNLLCVCHKFVTSLLQVCILKLNQQTNHQKPYHTRFGFIGWLINRIYNKQQYNWPKVSSVVSSQINIWTHNPNPLIFNIPIPNHIISYIAHSTYLQSIFNPKKR